METRRPIETPEARYNTGGAWLSPSVTRGHNWQPMSWNPQTGLVYIPARNSQRFYRVDPEFEPVFGERRTAVIRGGAPDPPEVPGSPGYLLTWDPITQQERWRFPHPSRTNGGTVTTAGNLVFSATQEGLPFALDATTGEKLWELQLPPGPSTPITYELDGQQYLTILSGPGGEEGPAGRAWTLVLDGDAPMPDG